MALCFIINPIGYYFQNPGDDAPAFGYIGMFFLFGDSNVNLACGFLDCRYPEQIIAAGHGSFHKSRLHISDEDWFSGLSRDVA